MKFNNCKNLFIITLLLLSVLSISSDVFAKTMHLHPAGTGTQHDNHYYGLEQIKTVSAGDIIYCHSDAGDYKNPFQINSWEGTAEHPIILMNASGEQPSINGYINIEDSQYIEIKGFTVSKSQYSGIMIQKNSHHITIAKCIVKNNPLGIWIGNNAGMANKILKNEVFHNSTHGIATDHVDCTPGNETIMAENNVYENGYHGFEISSNYYIIEKNIVHKNGSDSAGTSGIHLFALNSGDNVGNHNIIRYNTSYDNTELNGPDGNGIQLDQWCDDNEVYYNLCYHNDGAGINIFDSSKNLIYNNTLFGNMVDPGSSHIYKGELTLASDKSSLDRTKDNRLLNNIIVATDQSTCAIYIGSYTSNNQIEIKHNLFFNKQGSTLYTIGNDK